MALKTVSLTTMTVMHSQVAWEEQEAIASYFARPVEEGTSDAPATA
jgi:hypothetical protein